jgi:hypothetical protein
MRQAVARSSGRRCWCGGRGSSYAIPSPKPHTRLKSFQSLVDSNHTTSKPFSPHGCNTVAATRANTPPPCCTLLSGMALLTTVLSSRVIGPRSPGPAPLGQPSSHKYHFSIAPSPISEHLACSAQNSFPLNLMRCLENSIRASSAPILLSSALAPQSPTFLTQIQFCRSEPIPFSDTRANSPNSSPANRIMIGLHPKPSLRIL